MSDQSAADARPAAIANATQALAIKELTEEIGGVRKQFKALWIAVGVIGVVVLILASLTVIERVTAANRIGGFRNGTFNGQQVPGGTGTQQTTPGQ